MSTPTPDVDSIADVISEGVQQAEEATSRLINSLPAIGTRLALAALAILAGYIVLRLGKKLINRISSKKNAEIHTMRQRETLKSLANSVFTYLMYFVIATVVLSIFGVNISSILAVAGVGGVAIGFGAQTLVKDVISGIFLWAEGNATVGDTVEINSMAGTVEAISLRTTTIRNDNGDLYIVPNGDIRTVINRSRGFRCALVEVRLNYEESLERMLEILRDEMDQSRQHISGLREAPKVQGVTSMAADCITVRIAALCEPQQVAEVERALRRRIKNRFDKEKIVLPHAPVMPTSSPE